jgi:hypothetical protein
MGIFLLFPTMESEAAAAQSRAWKVSASHNWLEPVYSPVDPQRLAKRERVFMRLDMLDVLHLVDGLLILDIGVGVKPGVVDRVHAGRNANGGG